MADGNMCFSSRQPADGLADELSADSARRLNPSAKLGCQPAEADGNTN